MEVWSDHQLSVMKPFSGVFYRGLVGALFLALCSLAIGAQVQLISARDPSLPAASGGNGDSWGPLMSPNGRFVVFSSTANNLTTNLFGTALSIVPPAKLNVFVRDRLNGITTLASVNMSGTGGGNGDSFPTGVSTNGRYVCFESSASDLVPADTNRVSDIFVRDIQNNTTLLVSVGLNGTAANGFSRDSVVTPDGHHIAFTSSATNLVPGDTNGIADVFLRDLETATTTLISAGAKAADASKFTGSGGADISADGNYVAFLSSATNLVEGVSSGGELYLRDVVHGITTWASRDARTLLGTNCTSYNHLLSADGQFLAYEASVTTSNAGFIFQFSLATSLSTLISSNAYIAAGLPEDRRTLDMTGNGNFVGFLANANGSVGTNTCVYVWNASSGTSSLASVGLDGTVASNTICLWPAITPDGRYVAFLSNATNLVTKELTGEYHLFVRDLQTGSTALVNVGTNDESSSVTASAIPRISSDGALVAFDSLMPDLVAADCNRDSDVFIRNLTYGTNELISLHHPILSTASGNGTSLLSKWSLSTDGHLIAFASDADNLNSLPGNHLRQIYLRDLFLGTNILVSVGTNAVPADGISSEPAISGDGRFVAFTSMADNLTPGVAGSAPNVFLRDIQTGTTTLVSRSTNGNASLATSYFPIVSADGHLVLFRSSATDLLPGTITGENLYLRNMQTGSTWALTTNGLGSAAMTPDGRYVAYGSGSLGNAVELVVWDTTLASRVYEKKVSYGPLVISPDGNRIVYVGGTLVVGIDRQAQTTWSVSAPFISENRVGRFSADNRFFTFGRLNPFWYQIFVGDFATQTAFLVNAGAGGTAVNGSSDFPDISPDARLVAFRSEATNLLMAADANLSSDLFMFDRTMGITTLLSSNVNTSSVADNRSSLPIFDGVGRALFFESWASNISPNDLNHWGDIFSIGFLRAERPRSSEARIW